MVKEIDVDITLQLVKVKVDNPNYKHLVFMNERKIEEVLFAFLVIVNKIRIWVIELQYLKVHVRITQ